MRGERRARLLWGAVATGTLTLIARVFWGGAGAIAAGCFGALATAIQLLAARLTGGPGGGGDPLRVYLVGAGLRLAGVVILGAAVLLDRGRFPPLASAIGYVGTILPMLYLETRLTR